LVQDSRSRFKKFKIQDLQALGLRVDQKLEASATFNSAIGVNPQVLAERSGYLSAQREAIAKPGGTPGNEAP